MDTEVVKRNTSFEILRIILMVMITLHHITLDYGIEANDVFINTCAQFFTIGGKVGVNVFVLIGAYFLCEKTFSSNRVVKLYSQIWEYSIALLILAFIFAKDLVSIKTVLRSVFPVSFSGYWFATSYFGMLILSGIMNLIIRKLTYLEHSALIILGLLLQTIIPTFTSQTPFNSNIAWFMLLYFIGAYFRKYDSIMKQKLSNGWIFISMWFFIFTTSIVMIVAGRRLSFLNEGINFFSGMYILPQMIGSVSLFLWFEKRTINNSFINKVSIFGRNIFACYLIQSNCMWVYRRVAFNKKILNIIPNFFYPFVILVIALCFCTVAIGIDSIRIKLERILHIDRLQRYFAKRIDWMIAKSKELIFQGGR